MLDADHIKVSLLKWLLTTLKPTEVLASELRFRYGENRADLAIISNDRLCAIEIKSTRDDFRRLEKQLTAYQQTFLEVYLAVEAIDVQQARALNLSSIGLIVIKDGIPSIARKAAVRKQLKKEDALIWLTAEDLRRILRRLGLKKNSTSRDQLVDIAYGALTAEQLTKLALESLKERFEPRYNLFRSELGRSLTSDDVRLLSTPHSIEPSPSEAIAAQCDSSGEPKSSGQAPFPAENH